MVKPLKNKSSNKRIVSKGIKKTGDALPKDQFWGLEKFLEKNQSIIILIFLFVSLIFSFFLFDIKISEGGDDSYYIQRAWFFIKRNEFPFYQGPIYPFVLAIPIYFFGINLIVLKLTSVIFTLGTLWFTYLSFRKRIPYIVLFSLIFFLSANSYIQYYASQTYSEAFFLFLQAFVLYLIIKLIDLIAVTDSAPVKKIEYKNILLVGFGLMLMSLSKDIAIICIFSVVLFFLAYRKYKQGLFIFISFITWKVLAEVLIRIFYIGGSSHVQQMLLKDYYKPELGYETFTGMIDRFFANVEHFLSVSLPKLCHFRESAASQSITFLAIVLSLTLIAIAIFAYKRNKYIFFALTYAIILFCGVCVGLPANLVQDRHILIALPLIYMALIYGLYQVTIKSSSVLRFYFLCFMLIFFAFNLFNSIEDSTRNFKVLQKNIKGDIYYGFTEDWVNFLRMSTYCADSLPPSSFIASRKASMSFIYGKGKEFYPVFVVFSNNADTVLTTFKKDKVTHVIMASLRQNPKINNGQTINTLQRLFYPLRDRLTLVKQIGENEPAYLYKINY